MDARGDQKVAASEPQEQLTASKDQHSKRPTPWVGQETWV